MRAVALVKILLFVHSIGTVLLVLSVVRFLSAVGIALVAVLVVSLVVLFIHEVCLLFVVAFPDLSGKPIFFLNKWDRFRCPKVVCDPDTFFIPAGRRKMC